MSVWPDPDDMIIARYLATLRLRRAKSRLTYRRVLVGFGEIARRCSTVDQQMLEAWVRKWGARWQLSTLLNRARIIDRFLDHLAEMQLIDSNPIALLRGQYFIKQSRLVWQALTSERPHEALARLRQPEPFSSVLGATMRDHIALMRSRGYHYKTQAAWFLRFERFLQANPKLEVEPMAVMLEKWAEAKSTPQHAAECENLKQVLTKALRHRDPSLPKPRLDTWAQKEAARHFRKPHIYSPADVRNMLEIARSYPSPQCPLRPLSAYTMLLLAYCSGLRRSEVAGLDLGDVDPEHGTITIRGTKFFKTRILPLSDSVMVELRTYIDARQRAGAPQDPQAGLFWHDKSYDRYTPAMVGRLLVDIVRRAGLKPLPGRAGPRLHDLRHSMVVNRILQWYRSGINPQDRLPFLATYLGHRDINSTLVYITVTQDLLQEASERFRAVGATCLSPTQEERP
jgi:integrase